MEERLEMIDNDDEIQILARMSSSWRHKAFRDAILGRELCSIQDAVSDLNSLCEQWEIGDGCSSALSRIYSALGDVLPQPSRVSEYSTEIKAPLHAG